MIVYILNLDIFWLLTQTKQHNSDTYVLSGSGKYSFCWRLRFQNKILTKDKTYMMPYKTSAGG